MNIKEQLIFLKFVGWRVEELKKVLEEGTIYRYISNNSIIVVGSAICTEENGVYQEFNRSLPMKVGDTLDIDWGEEHISKKECWMVYR